MAEPVYKQLEALSNELSRMENLMIDPAEFGELKGEFKALARRVDDIANDVRKLVELANQGKGGLWVFRGVYVMAGGVLAWAVDHFFKALGK